MPESIVDIIQDLTIYFALFYPLLYLRGFAGSSKAFKAFTFYIILMGLVQFSARYVVAVHEMENLFLSHFYYILQFIFLSIFYYALLNFKWVYYILAIVMCFLAYQYIEDPNIFFRYNSTGMVITHVILVLYALLYMYKSLTNRGEFQIVNVGIFVYLLASALIFASGNLVFNINIPTSVLKVLTETNVFLYFGLQSLIFVEWWKNYSVPRTNL